MLALKRFVLLEGLQHKPTIPGSQYCPLQLHGVQYIKNFSINTGPFSTLYRGIRSAEIRIPPSSSSLQINK